MPEIPPKVSTGVTGQSDGLPSANVSQVPVPGARRTSSSSSAQTVSGSSMSTMPPSSKIAIPRHRTVTPLRHHSRVPRACASCRTRKTKCSGDTPVCRQCHNLGMRCVYPPALREKMKMKQEGLSKQLRECQSLLGDLEPFVSGHIAKRVKVVLQHLASGYSSDELSSGNNSRSRTSSLAELDKPASSPSSVGSLDALDQVEDDINLTEESRATGHIGKSSEITWMQRLQKAAEDRRQDKDTATTPADAINDQPHDLNYHLDDLDITVSEPVQKYWVPSRPLADKLFETYLLVAHPYFPIINRSLFSDQYRAFFDSFALPGNKWMAILNLIFAVAANFAHAAELDWRGDPHDHLVYLTRARMLSMDGDDLFHHPDLQQVQVEGLIAFYLLSTDQIHRAWRISALAIRSAVSLGINLKNNSQSVTSISKEIRNRVWWSLYIVENKLGMMTGRPTCISINMCSSPFPLPWGEAELLCPNATLLLNDPILRDKRIDAAMASSYEPGTPMGRSRGTEDVIAARTWLRDQPASPELCFLYSCDLTMITQEVLDRVYTIQTVNRHWSSLRDRLVGLQEKLDLWVSSLPKSLDFTRVEDNDAAYNEKLRLAFQYHGARILLGRTCLCQHKASQSDEKQDFNRAMALSALDSAAQIASLIPDGQHYSSPQRSGPWWCLLHSVMQAVTIMILEISLGSIHMPEGENNLLQLTHKCVRWLQRTSEHSIASRRAWQLCDTALRRLDPSMEHQVSDLSSHSYWQGQRSTYNYFAFSPPERQKMLINQVKEAGESNGNEPAMTSRSRPDGVHIAPSECKSELSNPVALISSGPVEDGDDEGSFAYGPLGQEFIRMFFPELGSDGSLNGSV